MSDNLSNTPPAQDMANTSVFGIGAGHDEIDMAALFNVLWRRKFRLIGTVLLVTGAAAFATVQMTPTYTATAELMVDTRGTKVVEIEQVIPSLAADGALIQTQAEILRSPSLMQGVVDRLKLNDDPEFNPFLRKEKKLIPEWLRPMTLIKTLSKSVSADTAPKPAPVFSEDSVAMPAALHAMNIRPVGQSYIIQVNFTSEDPVKAARIANTITEIYLEKQVETKLQATRQANAWLEERLKELQAAVIRAEREVERYREEAGLIVSNGMPISQQQLSEINSQLIVARTERSAAEARYQQLELLLTKADDVETAPEVLDSALIRSLREQETQLLRRVSELSNRYRPGHPSMIYARDELHDLRGKIALEVRKVISGVASQVAVARIREKSLEASLEALSSETAQKNQAQTQLRALEREAQASKTLYTTFLNRFKETREQEGLFQPDAQILSPATAPPGPSHPKTKLIIAGAFAASFAVISLTLLLLTVFDRSFRTTNQVQSATGLRVLGMVPSVPHLTRLPGLNFVNENLDRVLKVLRLCFYLGIAIVTALSLYPSASTGEGLDKILHVIAYFGLGVAALVSFKDRGMSLRATALLIPLAGLLELGQLLVPGRSGSLLDFCADVVGILLGLGLGLFLRSRFLGRLTGETIEPGFEFQEAIRRVSTGLTLSNRTDPPRTVLVTSSLPDEGKSVLSASLAQFMGRSDRRCLLIDCDLRRPSLQAILRIKATTGLADVLSGKCTLEDAVQKTHVPNLDFLAAGDNEACAINGETGAMAMDRLLAMLETDLMKSVVEEAKARYELVIIDSPAVTVVSEARVLTRLAEKTVFVMRWGKTRRNVSLAGLNEILNSGGEVAGIVLTRVDRRKLRLYESPESSFLYTSYLGYGGKSYAS